MADTLLYQWILMLAFGLFFFIIAPISRTPLEFFRATTEGGKQPGAFMLTCSLVIAWIFAKSIANAANLGMEFGLVGGVAYATYYLSFLVAGVVIYFMRVKGGFSSIHQFLATRYGKGAITVFSILIAFRLFNEVWSNSMVIGSYFGEPGTGGYYTAILLFTGLVLAYSLKGGLRSSILTDAIQMILFAVLLVVLLGIILPSGEEAGPAYLQSGEWTLAGGLNLLFVALIQIFSYPFHDPVLTDRGFITKPGITLKSYISAAVIGFMSILLFSFIGIFARFQGLEGQAAVAVSKLLGVVVMLAMNFIMITSAASTVDSTFASFSKLAIIDLGKERFQTVSKGRLAMIAVAILGTIPVFTGSEILSATTISGTMVIGFAPVFLFWFLPAPRLSFHLSVGAGMLMGLLLALGYPGNYELIPGKHGNLLALNLTGTVLCFILFFLPMAFKRHAPQ